MISDDKKKSSDKYNQSDRALCGVHDYKVRPYGKFALVLFKRVGGTMWAQISRKISFKLNYQNDNLALCGTESKRIYEFGFLGVT